MNVFKPLTTPEYLFRPRQIVHRFQCMFGKRPEGEYATVSMPWGAPLRVRPGEVIGSNVWSYGVFDLVVTEAISRLLDPGEAAIDIGANMGQMTSLMCCQAGAAGRVIAFEPHPELFAELQFNVSQLPAGAQTQPTLHQVALSDHAGSSVLDTGHLWEKNRGLSKLVESTPAGTSRCLSVKLAVLDEILAASDPLGATVIKMDVEGHELKVLQGAARALRSGRLRDIIFEDLDPYPSRVHEFLRSFGYEIFSLHSMVWRPRLSEASSSTRFQELRDGRNYVATLDPKRAVARFAPLGWKSLRRR